MFDAMQQADLHLGLATAGVPGVDLAGVTVDDSVATVRQLLDLVGHAQPAALP